MRKIFLNLCFWGIIGCSFSENPKNLSIPKGNRKILWEMAGLLPPQKGMSENAGVAGMLYGTLNNKYIVVGGGANFPYESVLNGGKKKNYSDLYLLEDKKDLLEVVEQINLENEIAYGCSITTPAGIYYIGGSNNPEADNDILLITLKNNKLNVEKVGELPFTLQNAVAVEKDSQLYIMGGKQNGVNTNKMFVYNLNTKETKELAPIPGFDTRTQPVGQILNGFLYVFSGGDKIAYTDGYKYDFTQNVWSKVSDVSLNNTPISLLGASSVKLNDKEMLVIGGFNKQVYDDAVAKLTTLKDKELQDFKHTYFTADPKDFNWNTEILIYNAQSDSWSSMGNIPFNAPCGEGLVLIKNTIYSINGEIKPGIRTPKMFRGVITAQ